MKKGQVFVRAQTPSGKWVSADFLDLTLESQQVFLMDLMVRHHLVVGLKRELVLGDEITYTTKTEVDD